MPFFRVTAAYILCDGCNLPVPEVVNVLSASQSFSSPPTNVLPISRDIRDKRLFLSSCLPPLHAQFAEVHRLIEWVELNRLLGVEHFTIYVENTTEEVRRVLDFYASTGVVEVLTWNIPVSDIHYHGQLAAINDCLYRNKHRTKYLMITDADEFLIPQRSSEYTLIDLIKKLGDDKSVYMFRHTRFHTMNSDFKPDSVNLLTQNALYRRNEINPYSHRSKLLVSTEDIVTLGIHTIWAANVGKSTSVVETDMGLLHHYRGEAPVDIVSNNVTSKYRQTLEAAVQKVHTALNLS